MNPAEKRDGPVITMVAVLAYAILYCASLAVLGREPGFEAGEPLAMLLFFGLVASGVAWVATRGITPTMHPVAAPRRESCVVLGYLALFAVVVLGWGFSAIKDALPDGRIEDGAIVLAKLATMVALPALLFMRMGYTAHELFGALSRGGRPNLRLVRALVIMAVLMLALQLLFGRGAQAFATLTAPAWLIALAVPFAFALITIEAGLTEEFLFRVLLQTRLAAWLKSEVAAVLLMALVFGLAHAPGLVLRGAHLMEGMTSAPDALTAAAYAIVKISPVGLMFGVLWARTRSLLLVVLLHGFIDLVPNLAPFVRTWL